MRGRYIKLAFRNLFKYKSFTLFNLIALGGSLAACIVIFTNYTIELSHDKHIPGPDRSFRIITRLGEGQFWSRTFACYGDALAERPEVEDYSSFLYTTENIVQTGESSFTVNEAVIARAGFMDFFDIKIITGRKEDLGQPNKVFLTRELAGILFPGENAYGKEISFHQYAENTLDSIGYFTVAGIVKPLPENTHFGFQMIISQEGNLSEQISNLKERIGFTTNVYVRLYNRDQVEVLEDDLTEIALPYLENRPGPPVDAFSSRLQAVKDIHFTKDINREPRPTVRKSMVYILLSVGFLILILMSMNFVSTAIVQSHLQRKQRDIMRTLGANKLQLFQLSLLKIAMFVGFGLLIAWLLIACLDSYLEGIFGSTWSFRSLNLKIILLGLVTGIPITLLAALGMHRSGSGVPHDKRNQSVFGLLTIVQFSIVIVLMGFSVFIKRQIVYMDNKDLGYTDENVFIARIPSAQPRGSILVEEIRKHPGVISASTAHHHPGDIFQSMEFSAGDKKYPFGFRMADSGIFETLDIKLLHRFGAPGQGMEGWVINETFYNSLLQDFSREDICASNFDVDTEVSDPSRASFTIGGVMKDFHYSSLHSPIGNFAFVMRPPETLYNRWLLVHYAEVHSEAVLAAIQQLMDDQFPGRNYDFFSLKDKLHEKYGAAHRLSNVISAFTLLSILIAGFGLYSLSMFITQRRSKEIGIRKAFGADSWRILAMLNFGFLKWLGTAFLMACPISIWALKKWQINFAYNSDMPWWVFGLIFIVVVCIALLAVTLETSKAARSNPADIIRHD